MKVRKGRVRVHFSQLPALTGGVALLALAGCASKVPESIRVAPVSQPSIEQAQQSPQRYAGAAVRWGGELVEVRNSSKSTELEILGRKLDNDGEPRPSSKAQGRFLARAGEFIDPADYQNGQLVTVAGTLNGMVEGKVGEYDYQYPVVDVVQTYRWPDPLQTPVYPAYPWPYYGPYWPHRYYGPSWPHRYYGWPYPWWY